MVFLLFLLVSCNRQEVRDPKKVQLEIENDWGILEVSVENDQIREKIGIFYDNDTCRYRKTIIDTVYFKKHGSFPGSDQTFLIDKAEKKKIYNLFCDVINDRVYPASTVSCYAGDYVSFSIGKFGNPEVVCKYSSVADWHEISPAINKIYNLTFRKVYNQHVKSSNTK